MHKLYSVIRMRCICSRVTSELISRMEDNISFVKFKCVFGGGWVCHGTCVGVRGQLLLGVSSLLPQSRSQRSNLGHWVYMVSTYPVSHSLPSTLVYSVSTQRGQGPGRTHFRLLLRPKRRLFLQAVVLCWPHTYYLPLLTKA